MNASTLFFSRSEAHTKDKTERTVVHSVGRLRTPQ
jgi:hypothetical protein